MFRSLEAPVATPRAPRRHLGSAVATALATIAIAACRVGGQGPSPAPLPYVSAEAAAARGIDVRTLKSRLDRAVQEAVRDGAFPGAVALVGSRAGILALASGGQLDVNDAATPNERTIWDLASLTKVIGMTSAMERLVQAGKIDLDAPVQRYLPEWTGPGKDQVRIRHLLTHSAGLPAWRPLYKEAASPAQAMALVLATPLDTVPGVRMVYSDLGAILLGEIVRRVSGAPLDAFVDRKSVV